MAGRTKELVAMVAAALQLELAPFGDWRYAKTQFRFVQPFAHGQRRISLNYKSWGGKFLDLSFTLGVRFDAVEDLMNLERPYLSANEKRRTGSFGVYIINITGKRHQSHWDIEDETSAAACAREFGAFMKDIGMAYFEKYSDPPTVLRTLLSAEDRHVRPGMDDNFGMLVAALSYLLEPDHIEQNVERVVRLYIRNERDIAKIKHFVARLKSLPRNPTLH